MHTDIIITELIQDQIKEGNDGVVLFHILLSLQDGD